MAGVLLSKGEKDFILEGIKYEFRSDGRSNTDYRPMELETDVVSHASGSARLRLANTDILVGIKTEIDVPTTDQPRHGKIEFFVDCSANATPEFEGRGGEQLANSISNIMQDAYRSAQAFNLEQLCIMEGKQCWKLYVDILILESGGNLYDAVSIAVKAALFNTRIPKVKAVLMDGGDVDLQLSDDPYDCKYLEMGTTPLLVTLCKVGSGCVVDPSAEEESCSIVSVLVGVTGNPNFYKSTEKDSDSHKMSTGGKCSIIRLNGCGSLVSATVKDAIKQGQKIAVQLDENLAQALIREREHTVALKKHSYGFLN